MARRVARGLFRVWLVLSSLWIVGVIVVTLLRFPALSPWWTPEGGMFDDIPDAPGWYQKVIQGAAEVALIPPALSLVVGAALGWAIKGFRG